MIIRIVACTAVLIGAMAQPASAGIWAWGCMGQLGNERVIFDRNTMIVTSSKLPQVKLQNLASSGSNLETQDGMTFDNLGSNDGLGKTMVFKINDTSDRKLTLTDVVAQDLPPHRSRGKARGRDDEIPQDVPLCPRQGAGADHQDAVHRVYAVDLRRPVLVSRRAR